MPKGSTFPRPRTTREVAQLDINALMIQILHKNGTDDASAWRQIEGLAGQIAEIARKTTHRLELAEIIRRALTQPPSLIVVSRTVPQACDCSNCSFRRHVLEGVAR